MSNKNVNGIYSTDPDELWVEVREGFAEEVATERRFEGGLKGVKRVVEMGVI